MTAEGLGKQLLDEVKEVRLDEVSRLAITCGRVSLNGAT